MFLWKNNAGVGPFRHPQIAEKKSEPKLKSEKRQQRRGLLITKVIPTLKTMNFQRNATYSFPPLSILLLSSHVTW